MTRDTKLKNWIKSTPALKRAALLSMRVAPALRASGILRIPRFIREWRQFRSSGGEAGLLDFHPCLFDRTASTAVEAQYFYQAIWAARRIVHAGVALHLDVASQTMFVGMLTAFVDVIFVDIRPIGLAVERLTMCAGSITQLPFDSASVTSLSSLHVIEHIGLGRYGDPIEARGPERAASELERVLAPGGRLYLSTPIGRPRVQFNSQRIFSTQEIVRMFSRCTLKEFSVVDAASVFRQNVPLSTEVEVEAAGSDFGLGMFVFEKRE